MAGQRYRFAMGLVFGSVAPVMISIMVIWSLLRLEPGGYGGIVLALAAFFAIIAPYVIGWVRSYLALVGSAMSMLVIRDALGGDQVLLVVLLSVAAVAAIAALAWFSLRFGHVRRPADAREPGAAKSTMWPYPYA